MGSVTMGKIRTELKDDVLYSHSMFVRAARIQDLWNLDVIGIHDMAYVQSKDQLSKSAMIHFNENVKRFRDGRYEVSLPWINGHPTVSSNRILAEQRLRSAIAKLRKLDKLDVYQRIFDEWLETGIIEEVKTEEYDKEAASYLPHHPVFNEKSLTTPVRPVFDASARSKGFPSLTRISSEHQIWCISLSHTNKIDQSSYTSEIRTCVKFDDSDIKLCQSENFVRTNTTHHFFSCSVKNLFLKK